MSYIGFAMVSVAILIYKANSTYCLGIVDSVLLGLAGTLGFFIVGVVGILGFVSCICKRIHESEKDFIK